MSARVVLVKREQRLTLASSTARFFCLGLSAVASVFKTFFFFCGGWIGALLVEATGDAEAADDDDFRFCSLLVAFFSHLSATASSARAEVEPVPAARKLSEQGRSREKDKEQGALLCFFFAFALRSSSSFMLTP